jgi:hypothetical protein
MVRKNKMKKKKGNRAQNHEISPEMAELQSKMSPYSIEYNKWDLVYDERPGFSRPNLSLQNSTRLSGIVAACQRIDPKFNIRKPEFQRIFHGLCEKEEEIYRTAIDQEDYDWKLLTMTQSYTKADEDVVMVSAEVMPAPKSNFKSPDPHAIPILADSDRPLLKSKFP